MNTFKYFLIALIFAYVIYYFLILFRNPADTLYFCL